MLNMKTNSDAGIRKNQLFIRKVGGYLPLIYLKFFAPVSG